MKTHRTIVITGVAVAVTSLAACGPPTAKPAVPQCGPYSVVHEAAPLPCVPRPGDRVDYVLTGPITAATPEATRVAAVARCGQMGGTPQWSDTVELDQRILICRTAGGAP